MADVSTVTLTTHTYKYLTDSNHFLLLIMHRCFFGLKIINFCNFSNYFYGCHLITSNQIRFEDMFNSSVFYLIRGVEEAAIKSVLKKLHRLLLSLFYIFCVLGPILVCFRLLIQNPLVNSDCGVKLFS